MEEKIDIVLLWVDGNDEKWYNEKIKYEKEYKETGSINRYRDCNNLQYVFRGIEKYASWINKIYFVTWGHIPKWLNTEHEKLVIVNHKDFIPEKYLPTFNSNVIELNAHRIKGLSDKFILFNDDLFLLKETKPTDFFKNGLPSDVYVEFKPMILNDTEPYYKMLGNVIKVINKHFNKKECMQKNYDKFVNDLYGNYNKITEYFMEYEEEFVGFYGFHAPQPFLKETFNVIWEKEQEQLDVSCRNKFRAENDLSQFLCRYWQLVSGNFEPKKDESQYIVFRNDNTRNIKELKSGNYKYICINDAFTDIDFNKSSTEINAVLEELLPEKSKFEI